jgi:hypothetical protein
MQDIHSVTSTRPTQAPTTGYNAAHTKEADATAQKPGGLQNFVHALMEAHRYVQNRRTASGM